MSEIMAPAIDVKRAVRIAKAYVRDAFSEDDIEKVGLEEISFDEAAAEWRITIGFSRPWDQETLDLANFESGQWSVRYQEILDLMKRTYKVVHLSAVDGCVRGVENRPV